MTDTNNLDRESQQMQICRYTDNQTRDTHTETHRHRDTETHRHTDTETLRHTDTQRWQRAL